MKEETPKYSAIPPHTPYKALSVDDLVNFFDIKTPPLLQLNGPIVELLSKKRVAETTLSIPTFHFLCYSLIFFITKTYSFIDSARSFKINCL